MNKIKGRKITKLKEKGAFEHQKVSMPLENNQTEITVSCRNETPPDKNILNNHFAIPRVL